METERLLLRNRSRALIEEMLSQSRASQMAFFGFETVAALEEKLIRVKKGLANTAVDYCIFDLIKKESNEVIGSGGFHNWKKEHCRTEIGYELHQRFRGQGYMREAIPAILRYGFQKMNLNRIEALVAPDNEKSIRLIEEAGFVKEGILKEHYKEEAGFEDSILYALLKSSFEERE